MEKLKGKIKKEYLLLAGTLLLLVISYRLAFQKTIEAWQLNNRLTKALIQQNDLSYQPGYLERKQHNLQQVISRYRIDSTTFRNNTLARLSEMASTNQCRIIELPSDAQETHAAKYIINKVVFEGDYAGLVKLLDAIEKAKDAGVLRSANFSTTRHDQLQTEGRLTLTAWLEIVK
ncbi:hypothetical protein C8P68_11260 [Mucilaginibacter yixingensis]|uniref:Uncharacterized protein n=1 Tax=Mucilaginibacter yixingensis TaxID=1295612 RepID=A0A2T5J4L9_9SPHI|nr:hypothetical protein [Mucilaginibacter yixingensis]PTQ92460.1 hypothetical protein C8P68_11260 [Mucilaginibacter yixingensis]